MKKRGPWLLVLLMAGTVAALLAVLLLTGGDGDVDAEALLAAAPAAVEAEGTAAVDLSVSVDNDALDVSVDAIGAVDFETGLGWLTVDLPGRSIETRTDGTVLYVLPEGDETWLAVHADESGSLGAGTGEVLAFVDLLGRDASRVSDRGIEEIDGRDTRHVRATVDVEGVEEELADLVPSGALPLDVWIDDAGLPVRMRLQGETRGIGLVITLDLRDWGTDLGVDIPPQGAVRDVEADETAAILGASPE